MAMDTETSGFTERQIVTFRLGEDEFGADIMDVREIIRVPEITKIPNAPDYIEGACNLRGNVLPVIDGRSRLNMSKKANDEASRVLVIDENGKSTGVIVDKVSEVMRVNTADIEEAPRIVKNVDSDYLNGVVKMNNGKRLILLLDVVKAVSAGAMENEHAMANTNDTTSNNAAVNVNDYEKVVQDEEQLVTFLLAKEEYAISIMNVKEIIRVPEIVKIPSWDKYIEGVVSIRNNLLPIINLRTYFNVEYNEINDTTRILVVDMGNFTAGIMVDKVSEVLRVPKSVIQPPPKFSSQNGEQLKGVAKLNDGKRMILLLEPSKLMSMDEYSAIGGTESIEISDAVEKSIEMQSLDEEQLVTFKIDTEEFGIKIANVQEINRMTGITKIPRAPSCIDGIVNLRGNIIPALNLRKLFGLEEKQETDATRIIIVDLNGKKTGIIVDSVSEVLRIEKVMIEDPPKILSSGIDRDYIEKVSKKTDGNKIILILNLDKVLCL